jgi:serine/threonine protein kinase
MEAANDRVEMIFDAALELPNAPERALFLERECGGDPELRARVEKLLAAFQGSEKFFEECKPALALAGSAKTAGEKIEAEEELGQWIGRYKLLQKIGEGGCGVVYMAEQQEPVRRKVALKIIKLGMDTRSVIARFEAERQALAIMDHPNIARVLDAGATEKGRPFFVMELVNGVRITEYCDQRHLDTGQRLELFIQVCHAIQNAHQKGIIHRDIKPSNILVTLHDGEPVPKVIDFGIAKATEERLTDKTLFTVYGHFVGTPAYMSPEQADFSGLDIDTRSDIYSLGVLLYELLTGKTPFEQNELLESGLDEMRKTLREREPHRPSTKLDTLSVNELTITATQRHIEPPKLQSLLKGDLDWIVMKCLEKDRKRRYETANGVAMDVQRHLNDEPVLARPPSRWYRFQKSVQRNRAVFVAGSAVVLALVIGLGAAVGMFLKERRAEEQAERARASEATLRQLAETREKITQAALYISEGKLSDADDLVSSIDFKDPTLEGAAVLRSLGKWHALAGDWPLAAARFWEALKVDQFDNNETISQDLMDSGAVLAAADNTNQFEILRYNLTHRVIYEKNSLVTGQLLKAGLFLPGERMSLNTLLSLAQAVAPTIPTSVSDLSSSDAYAPDILRKLKLQNIGSRQACSMQINGDGIMLSAGGANIWEGEDQFAYASAPITGDFDFRMRVHSISPKLNDFTRVGLMARESVNQTDSRQVMVAVNANDTFQVLVRSQEGAQAASVPENPLPTAYGPNSWVRLQRVGAIFHAYTSSNGVDWTQLYLTTVGDKPFSDPIYFGLAASSHDSNSIATNVLSNFGPTPVVSADLALTLALLDYRLGDFEQSAVWCQRLLSYPECNAVQLATAQVIQALVSNKLGQPDEAGSSLTQARQVIEKKFSAPLDEGNSTDGFWFDWVLARELLREADKLNS